MRFREVERRLDDIRETNEKEIDNFKNIKPETNITYEEATNFWNNLFMAQREEA